MQFFTRRVTHLKRPKLLAIAVFLVVSAAPNIQAQVSFVRISVLSLDPAKVRVDLNGQGSTEWSFRNTYTAIVGLADRIEDFHGKDYLGQEVRVRRLAPGEFRFSEKVTQVTYDVLLSPPAKLADLSHVSWLNKEHGLLMLGDLLPSVGLGPAPTLNLNFELPPGWISASGRNPDGHRHIVSRPEREVFVVGPSLRRKTTRVGTPEIKVVTAGDWSFSESEVGRVAGKIVEEYTRVFRHPPPANIVLQLVPFGGAVGAERWSAETRGQNVVLLMGRSANKGAQLARLKVVLAHELFHLWIPNSLDLRGDYDWFFEGFALYQALLTSLRLHYITFEDYLETVSRVYDSYHSSIERDKLSLLDASERRWTSNSTFVYDKGALVAFIYDLMLRRNSASREMITDIYPEVLRAGQESRRDANELLIKLLNRRKHLERFGERFVEGTADIDLVGLLTPFGLEVAKTGSRTRIQVSKNIDKQQRQILKALGYKK